MLDDCLRPSSERQRRLGWTVEGKLHLRPWSQASVFPMLLLLALPPTVQFCTWEFRTRWSTPIVQHASQGQKLLRHGAIVAVHTRTDAVFPPPPCATPLCNKKKHATLATASVLWVASPLSLSLSPLSKKANWTPQKRRGQFGTGDSQLVTQASTNPAQRRLTSEF